MGPYRVADATNHPQFHCRVFLAHVAPTYVALAVLRVSSGKGRYGQGKKEGRLCMGEADWLT